jgi:hypothetical protein
VSSLAFFIEAARSFSETIVANMLSRTKFSPYKTSIRAQDKTYIKHYSPEKGG